MTSITSEPMAAEVTAPLRLGTAAEFAAVRALFERFGFDEATVLARLGGDRMFGFPRLIDGRTTLSGAVEDATAVLVRLFMDGEAVDAARVRALCGDESLTVLGALGLLSPPVDGADEVRASVFVVPVEGLWLASDLIPGRHMDAARIRRDFVFPPASSLTGDYLAAIPDAPGLRVLDLCTGAGITALRAARRGAAEVWASDVAPRSVHFVRFNAALNALPVTAVVSDVFDALGDETFDRIYAHPPYVPALAHTFDYRDAGADGEQVTRKVIAGLARHLRPGGRASLTCSMSDRADEPAQTRIRQWLGDASPAFDLVAFQQSTYDMLRAYHSVVNADDARQFVDLERWMRHFASLGIERFALLAIELRRDAGARPITDRRVAGPHADAATLDWTFAVDRLANDDAPPVAGVSMPSPTVMRLRPRVVPGLTTKVILRSDAALDWHTVGASVEVDHPVAAAVKLPPLAPTLLELCDGTRDAPALHAALVSTGLLEANVSVTDIARAVEMLLLIGAVEVPEAPVPRRPRQTRTTATSSVPTQVSRQ